MGTDVQAVDDTLVAELRRHWEDGWNQADVATIMAPFAAEVVFSSPFVPKLMGDSAVTAIVGRAALEDYVRGSLERAPGIRYTVEAAYSGLDGIVLIYTVHRPDGTDKTGADWMRLDADGRITEWRCHYALDFLTPDNLYLADDEAGAGDGAGQRSESQSIQ
jgi:hypothetical protein